MDTKKNLIFLKNKVTNFAILNINLILSLRKMTEILIKKTGNQILIEHHSIYLIIFLVFI